MIKNYLEYARRRRTYAIREARRALYLSRDTANEWLNGFYRGMLIPWSVQIDQWKQLQKDIEYHNSHGHMIASIGKESYTVYLYLS